MKRDILTIVLEWQKQTASANQGERNLLLPQVLERACRSVDNRKILSKISVLDPEAVQSALKMPLGNLMLQDF